MFPVSPEYSNSKNLRCCVLETPTSLVEVCMIIKSILFWIPLWIKYYREIENIDLLFINYQAFIP